MCVDRTGRDAPLELGNGLLAEMLGVGRATATVVTGTLQAAGLIRSDRGAISIVDREGLEDAACDCYRRVRDVFQRLLPASFT
jgi:DNA-binding transcriptional regulator YhcF (GntR family)